MKLTKILCPVDFSPASQNAMRTAVRIANASEAELVVAHAWHVPPMVYPEEPVFPADTLQGMIDEEERGLDAAVREARALGAARVSPRFLMGVPWDMVVEALRVDPEFDLVVMGTHGRSGLSRFLLGSVAEKVVRHAPCSVLAVHERDQAPAFRRILCPVDFSAASQHAVDFAARLVDRDGPGITLLHVIDLPVAYSGELFTTGFAEALDKRAAKLLGEWADRLRSTTKVPVTTRSRIGSAGGQIIGALEEEPRFDLAVVGSNGRTGIRRALLGSVAEKVVRYAPCPVLVARPRM